MAGHTVATAAPSTLPLTIAALPFFASGRYPKPDLIGRCSAAGIATTSGRDLVERVRDLGLGLAEVGMRRGDRVAIISESRPEWLFADFAILTKGAVTVPIYPTLSVEQVAYILRESEVRLAVASNAAQVGKLQAAVALAPGLATIVCMDPAPAGPGPADVVAMADTAAMGHRRIMDGWGIAKAFLDEAQSVAPDDLATIIYTSGTTGEPKGVELTHGNLASNVAASQERLKLEETDVALSFLPLCHAFERTAAYLYLATGVSIAFAESLDTLSRDLLAVRPTLMTGAPRVFEKIYARVLERGRAGGPLERRVFDWSMRVAAAAGRSVGGPSASWSWRLADRLVLSRVREGVGGRVRFFISGSAPLRKDLAEVFAGVGVPILEGYGLTETAPVVSVTPPGAIRAGTVGPPLSNVQVRIADDGEILVRGPSVMRGYYRKPAETGEALRNGWLHTGDIGALDEAGYLRITDRKKELIVTSGGKKIAPQAIEAAFREHPLVADVVLVGDGRRFVSAVILPDRAAVAHLTGAPATSPATFITDLGRADVLQAFQAIVDAVNAPLAQFERIKKFSLVPDEWTIASGILTPTLKVRRRHVEARYREMLERLYAE
jgi:long-chain acyl-CoA synthetase